MSYHTRYGICRAEPNAGLLARRSHVSCSSAAGVTLTAGRLVRASAADSLARRTSLREADARDEPSAGIIAAYALYDYYVWTMKYEL